MSHILSDQPARRDRLNFGPYVQTLADIIIDPATDTPLTVGVFGDWGRGKTSMMRMIERRILERSEDEQQTFAVLPVWFNAWLYSREEALWRALIARVLQAVQTFPDLSESATAGLRKLESRLYMPQQPESGELSLPPNLLPGLDQASLPTLTGLELLRRQALRQGEIAKADHLAQIIADVETSEALTRRDHFIALDDFRREFERLSHRYIEPRGRLVIFVDDLDRCLPESAVEVLEAIKLFLDVPGIAFVLGIDQHVLEEGIRVRYSQRYQGAIDAIDGARYLEKIIQLPLNLPEIQPDDIQHYIDGITAGILPDPRCETVFAVGLEPNPRRIKRTLNVFLLLWRLAQNQPSLADVIKPVRLAKIVVIQQYHRDLFELLTDGPHYLIDLEHRFRKLEEQSRPAEEFRELQASLEALIGEGQTEQQAEENPEISAGPLEPFLGRPLLRQLLTCTAADEPDANFIDLQPSQVAEYLFLSRSTEHVEEPSYVQQTSQYIPSQQQVIEIPPEGVLKRAPTTPRRRRTPLSFEPQLVVIPAGSFLMGTTEEEMQALTADTRGLQKQLASELPQHTLDLPAFSISRYPITNAEFSRFVEDGGYDNVDFWTEAGFRLRKRYGWMQPRSWGLKMTPVSGEPVTEISWYEAQAYCRWLSQKTGRAYRLPSEAEWEKAARGLKGRRYPWGDEPPDEKRCNFNNHVGHPTPVGQYSPQGDSPFGCADMAGNVWEWTRSHLAPYPYDPNDGREVWDKADGEIVLRGGGYADNALAVRCSARATATPDQRLPFVGFRVVTVAED